MADPTHADLHRDIGALQADMKNVKDDVSEIKTDAKEREKKADGQFASVNGKLDLLLAEREQRKGSWKTIAAIGGGAGTVAGFALPRIIQKLFG